MRASDGSFRHLIPSRENISRDVYFLFSILYIFIGILSIARIVNRAVILATRRNVLNLLAHFGIIYFSLSLLNFSDLPKAVYY